MNLFDGLEALNGSLYPWIIPAIGPAFGAATLDTMAAANNLWIAWSGWADDDPRLLTYTEFNGFTPTIKPNIIR